MWCQSYCQLSAPVHPSYAAANSAFQIVTVPCKPKSCLSSRANCPLQAQELPSDAALQNGQDVDQPSSLTPTFLLQLPTLPFKSCRLSLTTPKACLSNRADCPLQPKSCLSMLPCRMGRMLIRMVCSRDFSLGSNILPAVSLIWGTIFSRCSSCQPTYVLLGLIVSCTILTGMASWLLQPVSMSTDDDLLMQVWVMKPYMADPIWLCDPGPYPNCQTLFGSVTLLTCMAVSVLQFACDLDMIGLLYMAYPSGCRHKYILLSWLRSYPVKGHRLV